MDEYFLIHEVRYKQILQRCNDLTMQQRVRILDVGCYPYHLGSALEKLGHDVYGIASAHEPIHGPKIKICNIENDKFPFKDNFFDLVIFSEVLEHLPRSPVHALKEMRRVTKPDGHLLVTTPNIARSINRVKGLLGKSVTYPLTQVLEESHIYHRHNREYTMPELRKLTEFSGWNIKQSEYFISYTPMRKRVKADGFLLKLVKWANYSLMLMWPALRDTLMVIAQK